MSEATHTIGNATAQCNDPHIFVVRSQCPACEAADYRVLKAVPYRHPSVADFLTTYYNGKVPIDQLDEAMYEVARCSHCGLIFQTQILSPAWTQRLYDDWIDAGQSLNKRIEAESHYFAQLANEVLGITKLVRKKPRAVRVLDFGMGWGHWVKMAAAHGHDACGIELSRIRIEHCRRSGLRVIDSLDGLPSGYFHYIYANQVLEHIAEPAATLKNMVASLAPGGIIDIHVPNQLGVVRRLRSIKWRAAHDAVHPLEHINCFNRRSLRIMARRHGLRLIAPSFPHVRTPGTFGIKDIAIYIFNLTASTHVLLTRST